MSIVHYASLSKQALDNVIDEFISRDGNVLDGTLAQKRQRVLEVLKRGQAVISFDERSKSTHIHTKEEWMAIEQRRKDEY